MLQMVLQREGEFWLLNRRESTTSTKKPEQAALSKIFSSKSPSLHWILRGSRLLVNGKWILNPSRWSIHATALRDSPTPSRRKNGAPGHVTLVGRGPSRALE